MECVKDSRLGYQRRRKSFSQHSTLSPHEQGPYGNAHIHCLIGAHFLRASTTSEAIA